MSWLSIAALCIGTVVTLVLLTLAALVWRQWREEDDVVQMPGGETIFDPPSDRSHHYGPARPLD